MYLIFWIAYTSSTLLFVASSKFILVRGLDRIESVPGRFDEVVEAHGMTIVDEDLDDKGTEDSLLTRRMMMPMIPYSILLISHMETISKIYWTGDDLDEVIEKNENK